VSIDPSKHLKDKDIVNETIRGLAGQIKMWFALFAVPALVLTGLSILTDLSPACVAIITILAGAGTVALVFIIILKVALRDAVEKANSARTLIQERIHKSEPVPSPRVWYQIAASSIGVAKDNLSIITDIHDLDGTTEARVSMDVRAVTQDVRLLEHHYSIPNFPGGSIEDLVKLLDIRSAHKVTPKTRQQNELTIIYSFEIHPRVQRGKILPLSFRRESPAGTYAMTLQESKGRGEDDQVKYLLVRYPSNHLHSEVIFPLGYTPQGHTFDVWFGTGRVRHQPEYTRIETDKAYQEKYIEDGRFSMILDVEYPCVGLYYVLRWNPPK